MKNNFQDDNNLENFRPLSFFEKLFLNRDDLAEYYIKERQYLHDRGRSIHGMGWRSKFHPIMMKLMELNRKFIDKQTLTILKNEEENGDKPVIYAVTHMGKFDYQIVSEAIGKHQIPFSGDPETMYRTVDGVLLGLNGIIYCDTENKSDRKVATDTSIELLNSGHNLLIYPEGVWNVTSNLLMLPLFPGIIKMSLETGCDIVPVAIEQYDNHFIVNVGKNFKLDEASFNNIEEEKKYIELKKNELRDVMATLKWEIIESVPMQVRSKLFSYAKENRKFVDKRLFEWFNKKENRPFYDDEIIEHRTFKIKNLVFSKEAFAFFDKMKINKNNAFLFRKDLSLPKEVLESIDKELKGDSSKVR